MSKKDSFPLTLQLGRPHPHVAWGLSLHRTFTRLIRCQIFMLMQFKIQFEKHQIFRKFHTFFFWYYYFRISKMRKNTWNILKIKNTISKQKKGLTKPPPNFVKIPNKKSCTEDNKREASVYYSLATYFYLGLWPNWK